MTKSQCKKLFDIEGTKKSRKQFSVAIRRERMPNNVERIPGYNPDRKRLTRQEKVYNKIMAKLTKVAVL